MLEEELKAMNPDMGAIEAYARKDADYIARVAELDTATAQRDEVQSNLQQEDVQADCDESMRACMHILECMGECVCVCVCAACLLVPVGRRYGEHSARHADNEVTRQNTRRGP